MKGLITKIRQQLSAGHTAFITAIAALAVAVASCGDRQSSRPIVTVSLPPQKYLLEQVVGDKYDVRSLLSAGSDPENYDPSFTNLLNTRNSVAYLAMGNIGFEDAVVGKIRNENPSLPIYNTAEGVKPLVGTHLPGETDPHTWTSVTNARIIVANMVKAMSEADPSNSQYFERNGAAFTARLDSLDSAFRQRLAPLRGSAFLVWHPSLGYFARDYGLRQIALGGAEHKEVSIADLQAHIDEARASGAKVIFVQKDTDSRQAESANAQIGARETVIRPLDYDWMAEMNNIVGALAPAAPK